MIVYKRDFKVKQNDTTDLTGFFSWEIDLDVIPATYTFIGKIGPETWRRSYVTKSKLEEALLTLFSDIDTFTQQMHEITDLQDPNILKTALYPLAIPDDAGLVEASLQLHWDGDAVPPLAVLILRIRDKTRRIERETADEIFIELPRLENLKRGMLGSLRAEPTP